MEGERVRGKFVCCLFPLIIDSIIVIVPWGFSRFLIVLVQSCETVIKKSEIIEVFYRILVFFHQNSDYNRNKQARVRPSCQISTISNKLPTRLLATSTVNSPTPNTPTCAGAGAGAGAHAHTMLSHRNSPSFNWFRKSCCWLCSICHHQLLIWWFEQRKKKPYISPRIWYLVTRTSRQQHVLHCYCRFGLDFLIYSLE